MQRLPVHNLDPANGLDGQVPVIVDGKFVIGDPVVTTDTEISDSHTDFVRPLGPFTKMGIVLAHGDPGDWDAAMVESACPVWVPEAQMYALIYTGYAGTTASPTSAQLGIAWSLVPEGPYVKGPSPILGGSGVSGTPDETGVTGCIPWRNDDGTWTIFSIGLNGGGYEGGAPTLCRYTTPSLASPSFTRHGAVISPGGTSWRQNKVWIGSIVKVDDQFHIFLNGTAADGKERIGHGVASDINGSWTMTASPVLDVGSSGQWDSHFIGQPWVFKLGETWYMEYYGYDTVNASDGIATTTEADFPLGWTKHASNPFLSPSESYDAKHAHKPLSLVFPDRILHFYTAVAADDTRQVALAVIGREVGSDPGTPYSLTIEEDGVAVAADVVTIDFEGATVTDDGAGHVTVTIDPGSSSTTALVPLTSQIGTGDFDLVWTDEGELLMVEVPL